MRFLPVLAVLPGLLTASDYFAGAMGGVSALSADARTEGAAPRAFSGYKPENGPAALLFAGRHLTEYFSLQASYGWNRNDVALSGLSLVPAQSFELPMRSTIHAGTVEAMLYFRNRDSFARPYLSAGPGIHRLGVSARAPAAVTGSPVLPAEQFSRTGASLRVAVGIDLRIRDGFCFRYSFAETLQRNGISSQLRPPGQRNLANFQNFWGVLWHF
ncbi:MAG: outer membrane beta-barrel protein [Bryobacterales bacterium]|jgi:hypothetical protein|nr:outer membrane beta-barrel protein [Bryobacterales bacterium]